MPISEKGQNIHKFNRLWKIKQQGKPMANQRPKNIVQSDGDYPAGAEEQLRIGGRDPPGTPSN
jgi:hypothetical protein